MFQKNRVNPEREEEWRTILERFQQSGLSYRDFCGREGISKNTLQFWRKELRMRAEAQGLVSNISKGENRPSKLTEKASHWQALIDECRQYRGSINQFCQEKGVSSGNFYSWQQKLKRMGLTKGVSRSQPVAENCLVPVTLVDPPRCQSQGTGDDERIEVRLRDGKVLFLPRTIPAEILIQIINGMRVHRC
jgi:transposase-like protein